MIKTEKKTLSDKLALFSFHSIIWIMGFVGITLSIGGLFGNWLLLIPGGILLIIFLDLEFPNFGSH